MSNDFVPLKWQVPAFADTSRVLLLTGAAGGGKSRVAAEKFHAYMLKYPGVTGVVGRKDKTAAYRSVVPFLLYSVIGDTLWGNYHKGDGVFQYNNGSQAYVVGLRDESQRENLRSIGREGAFDIAWMEEANKLTMNDHQELSTRLRGIKGGFRQIIYSTNPDHPEHWIKKKLIDGKQASVYYSRPEDNPTNPPDYIEALQQLTGIFYDRMWRGLWVQAEGAIYSNYNSSIHLLERRVITPHNGRYIVTVDFGYTNPFSCTLWKINHDGVMFQVRQIYRARRLVEEHAPNIRKMILSCGIPLPRVEAWICDHDAEDRATLEKHLGITTMPAYKSISPGIEAVQVRWKENRLFLNMAAVDDPDSDLEKRYLPTCTADEIPGYSWSDKKAETPIDENNHGCDEMRYAVAYVDHIDKKKISVSTGVTISNYISQPQPVGV
jgi:phage terminase large subunit